MAGAGKLLVARGQSMRSETRGRTASRPAVPPRGIPLIATMSASAIAEHDIAAPASVAFAHFIDFTQWGSWMPRTFSPVRGPARALQPGDRFKIRVGKSPISIELDVVRFQLDR
jgi:hypothetical protein